MLVSQKQTTESIKIPLYTNAIFHIHTTTIVVTALIVESLHAFVFVHYVTHKDYKVMPIRAIHNVVHIQPVV